MYTSANHLWLLGWTTKAVTPAKDLGQCVSCFRANRSGETTTAAYTGIARTNVLVYSCLKLFLLLVLSLGSLKNHQESKASLRSFSLWSQVLR